MDAVPVVAAEHDGAVLLHIVEQAEPEAAEAEAADVIDNDVEQ